MNEKFEPGQWVICIQGEHKTEIQAGKKYLVSRTNNEFVEVRTQDGRLVHGGAGWMESRFRPCDAPPHNTYDPDYYEAITGALP